MLDNLYFGKDDAETDIGRGGLLSNGFIRTAAYENALNGRKSLILGRKGAGKSAISLVIQRDLGPQNRSCLVTPDEISAEEIKRFELGGIAAYQAKELLWRYIFCVQVAKFLIKNSCNKRKKRCQDHVQKLRQFLLDNNEADDLTSVERFWRTIEKLKATIKIAAFKSVEVSASIDASTGAKLNDKVEHIERELCKAASELEIGDPSALYLMIDQVERIWSNDPGSDALVIGLLRASKYIQTIYPFVKCIVFLRIDIYEKLDFGERDKLRSDEFLIRWDREDLIKLVEARAVASTGDQAPNGELWKKTFPRKVADVDVKKYIASRTLNRPRDIIQLCNACRDIAKSKGRLSITSWDVITASKQYSRWKLVDIQNEWSLNYPFLAESLLLISNGSYLFSRSDFKEKFDLVSRDIAERYPAIRQNVSVDYVLSVLFAVGVIGALREDIPVYLCESDSEEKLRTSDKQFAVHPGFRDALQCVSAFGVQPFEVTSGDADAVVSRIRRKSLSFEVGSSQSAYVTKEILFRLDQLRINTAEAPLTSPVKEELKSNFAIVQAEVFKATTNYDDVELNDTLDRAGGFLRELGRRLEESKVISLKHDLIYGVRSLGDTCMEYSLRRSFRYNSA